MIPPTVEASLGSLHTKSYFSPVPETIVIHETPVILGVDEAGRGPVVGPMVYGIAYCTEAYQNEVVIPNYEFDDSKKLTDPVRRKLFRLMYDTKEISEIGYATTCITPCDISTGMNRFPPSKQYNLNEQAHDTTMALIQGVLDQGVKLVHVYVDTVGPPASYQNKLERRFPGVKFTVAKKADSIYCVVSVASVVAKVTRDILVEDLEKNWNETRDTPIPIGSGYPSDPKTKLWLREARTPLFGWPANMVRFSWQTCQTLLDKAVEEGTGVDFQWEEDLLDSKKHKAMQTWDYSDPDTQQISPLDKLITLDNWYH